MHRKLSSIFECILPNRVEVIYFSECAFVIDVLDSMTLLGNVHILCIICDMVLEPCETSLTKFISYVTLIYTE
jgi:hypothetical protein